MVTPVADWVPLPADAKRIKAGGPAQFMAVARGGTPVDIQKLVLADF
jgi:hypothetical protein